MVDVHVIQRPTDNPVWREQCLTSLAQQDGVAVHLVDGIDGDIARAREIGFSKGDAPYVSFVDMDDYVAPGIFALLEKALERNPPAVMAYSNQWLVDEHGKKLMEGWSSNPWPFLQENWPLWLVCAQGKFVHHLVVIRRTAYEECLPLQPKRAPEAVLIRKLARRGWLIHVPVVGYYWRQHKHNTYKTYTDKEITELAETLDAVEKGAV